VIYCRGMTNTKKFYNDGGGMDVTKMWTCGPGTFRYIQYNIRNTDGIKKETPQRRHKIYIINVNDFSACMRRYNENCDRYMDHNIMLLLLLLLGVGTIHIVNGPPCAPRRPFWFNLFFLKSAIGILRQQL